MRVVASLGEPIETVLALLREELEETTEAVESGKKSFTVKLSPPNVENESLCKVIYSQIAEVGLVGRMPSRVRPVDSQF